MRLLYVKGREYKYDASYHQGCFLLVGAFRCVALESYFFKKNYLHKNRILFLVFKSFLNWSESKWLHIIRTYIHICSTVMHMYAQHIIIKDSVKCSHYYFKI